MSPSVLPMFSSKSFIVSGFTFRSLVHFKFIFVYGVRKCSHFILLHVAVQFSQHHLLKGLSLPHCIFLPPLSKIRYPQVHGFISGLSILLHCSIFLFLCQYYTVLMTVALQYNLKSGSLIPPAPFFFLKTALAIRDLLCFHMNCEIFCSSSVKNAIDNLIGIALNLQTALGNIVIFTILFLPTQESRISLHLFMSSLISFIQFSSVAQSCLTLCDPMNRSTPGLPVHHQPLEFTQTHVHRVSDAIQPSHPLSSPSPPAPNPSQHQGLFQRVNSSHEVAKVLEFQLQHHSLQINPRADLLHNQLVGSLCSPRDSQEFSATPQFKSINSKIK